MYLGRGCGPLAGYQIIELRVPPPRTARRNHAARHSEILSDRLTGGSPQVQPARVADEKELQHPPSLKLRPKFANRVFGPAKSKSTAPLRRCNPYATPRLPISEFCLIGALVTYFRAFKPNERPAVRLSIFSPRDIDGSDTMRVTSRIRRLFYLKRYWAHPPHSASGRSYFNYLSAIM